MRVRGYAWLVAALCLVPLTSACTGSSDKPSTLPSTSDSLPPTSSRPSPSASDGPEAAVVTFYRVLDAAGQAKVDVSALRPLFLDSCKPCLTSFNAVVDFRRSGQRVTGNAHIVAIKGSNAGRAPDTNTVTATIRTTPGRLLDGAGRVLRTSPGTPTYNWIFTVKRQPAGSVISEATIVPA